jgi:RNA polymerase primary sigma factor
MRQLKITKQVTNRETLSLDKYLSEIAKVPQIKPDEEADLARKIRDGDQKALDKLTKANLRFVVSVAKQYQNQGLTLGDLINEGNFGLIKAAKRFDETRGFKFISYAVWWIRQSILQALAEQSRIVRLPLNRVGAIGKINKAFSKLEQNYEREPTKEELSELVKISADDITVILASNSRHISMDAPLNDHPEISFGENFHLDDGDPTDHIVMTDSKRIEIARLIGTLTPRQKEFIILYYGFSGVSMTLEEIGERFDLTRERVRQIIESAIKKLRHPSRSKLLKVCWS